MLSSAWIILGDPVSARDAAVFNSKETEVRAATVLEELQNMDQDGPGAAFFRHWSHLLDTGWISISARPEEPPIAAETFTSDAIGVQLTPTDDWERSRQDEGRGCLGGSTCSLSISGGRHLICNKKDEKEIQYGRNKTDTKQLISMWAAASENIRGG
jgi:hypothetical protein